LLQSKKKQEALSLLKMHQSIVKRKSALPRQK